MFFSILRFFRGYVRVRVDGYAPQRLLNLCSNHGILMWDIRVTEGYEFNISIQAFRELKPYLQKTGTHVRICKRCGLPFFMHRYRKRKLFFCGIVICLLGIFLLSGHIWNVEINGNQSVSDEMVLSYLAEQESSFGAYKWKINCSELEADMRNTFPEIIWTSAQISGTKLTITIKENLITAEDVSEDTTEVCDIVADTEAVIDGIVTRAGTPMVMEGSRVATGDILVSGRIDILDDAKEVTAYEYCHSDADIYGIVTLPYEDSFPLGYTTHDYTGETIETYGIAIAGKEQLWLRRRIPYETWDEVTRLYPIHICSDFYLPFSLVKCTSSEYVETKHLYSAAEAKKLAEANFSNFLYKLTQKDIQILQKNVMIETDNKKCSSEGTITVRKRIGINRPTEVLALPADERPIEDELE